MDRTWKVTMIISLVIVITSLIIAYNIISKVLWL